MLFKLFINFLSLHGEVATEMQLAHKPAVYGIDSEPGGE
jgi:hypothetical protein